jgi:hypothetical protein
VEEILLHQQRANALCEAYAMRLKLDLLIVEAGDEKSLHRRLVQFLD